MNDDKDETFSFESAPASLFSSIDWSHVDAIFDEQSRSLRALAKTAGQKPESFFIARDFRGLSLRGVDIIGVSLAGANLRGTGVRYARLDKSTILEGAILDRRDRDALIERGLLKPNRPPSDFSIKAAKRLILSGKSPPLAWRPWIERLIFLFAEELKDLAPLAGLTALQSLDLQGAQVQDLAPLAGLTALRSLNLQFTQVQDLAPLAGLTALQLLFLRGTQVQDLAPLAGLTALQWLDLQRTQVQDLAPLAGLTALQWLDLQGTQVQDLAPLAGLTDLQVYVESDRKALARSFRGRGKIIVKPGSSYRDNLD